MTGILAGFTSHALSHGQGTDFHHDRCVNADTLGFSVFAAYPPSYRRAFGSACSPLAVMFHAQVDACYEASDHDAIRSLLS